MLGLGDNLLRDLEDSEMYLGDVRVIECYLGDKQVYPIQKIQFGVNGILKQNDE